MSKIILGSSAVNGEFGNLDAVLDYEDNKLLRKGGDAFQMNLYPLGKPKENSWDEVKDNYCRWFGFQDEKQYAQAVKDKRFGAIYDFWNKCTHKKITICFGAGHQKDYQEIFRIKDLKKSIDYSDIYYAPNDRFILTPFFGYGLNRMTNEKIREVARIAGEWIRA